MLRILLVVLSIIVTSFIFYGVITQNFEYIYLMQFFLGLAFFVVGLEEFKKERKASGWFYVVLFLIMLSSSIFSYLQK
ncbi:DUF3953 domain-containing protein [Paraliobacillus quinghaiensis]|uniref:DUF3953 domain-containing protein n=1 Tax=Paraliobacillus quinghaiensis TaxID=470815 RepID=UPI0013C2A0BE|nr:DUF3953 domain-containing protein [Paraliobacillus quinghaiensis]